MERIKFNCTGTVQGMMYTKEEGIRLLSDFQDEIIRDYRSRFGRSLFNRKYFTRNLEFTADEHQLGGDPAFLGLKKDFDVLGAAVSSWRNDLSGEERARRAMSRILPGEEMEVLYGVTLRDGQSLADIDAVAVTPYGVFAIEVESCNQDLVLDEKGIMRPAGGVGPVKTLGDRMYCNELFLRNKLKDYMNVPVYSILLVTDNRVQVTDSYGKIPVSRLNTIMSDIRSYSDGKRYITRKQMQEIEDALLEYREPAMVLCPVDCRKIADEYTRFVSRCAVSEKKTIWSGVHTLFGRRALHGADIETV